MLTAQQAAPSAKSDAEIIRGIDAAVLSRATGIARYTVQEHYALYRNGEAKPSAEETIQTVYIRATGKQYTPIAQSGSALLRASVIDRILAGEKEVNLPANREASWITSANYELQPRPGQVQRNGRTCILVDINSRRKSPHLFRGQVWVDASDFSIVRFEGSPSQSPSLFAGQTTVSRDYAKVDGFAMATHAEARSHSFLLGDTLIKIDYTNYQIEREPSARETKAR